MNTKKSKLGKIFWGICFISAAVLLVLSGMNLLPNISVISILFTAVFVGVFIRSAVSVNFFGMLMSLALIACIYEKPLGIESLVPWTILCAALLASIGLEMIFHKKPEWAKKNPWKEGCERKIVDEPDKADVYFTNSFASSIKYVNTDHFHNAYLKSSFGEMQVYFDNAILDQGSATIQINNSFGCIRLFIPNTWRIDNQCSNSFSSIIEKNAATWTEDGPLISLTGANSFGAIEITYI